MSNRLVKFGKEKKQKYLNLLKEGGRRYASARAVGVSYETIRLHLHKDADFAKAVDESESEANQLVEDALFQAACSGNVVACQVWLYNRDSERWKDQRNLKAEITGKDGGPIETLTIERFVQAAQQVEEYRRARFPEPSANGTGVH